MDRQPSSSPSSTPSSINHLDTHFLHILFDHNSPHLQRQNIIKHASTEQMKEFLELVYNMIHGNISVTKKQITQLRKHKRTINILVNDRVVIERKQKILANSYHLLLLFLSILGPWVHEHVFESLMDTA